MRKKEKLEIDSFTHEPSEDAGPSYSHNIGGHRDDQKTYLSSDGRTFSEMLEDGFSTGVYPSVMNTPII
jgi:hypothetical protein